MNPIDSEQATERIARLVVISILLVDALVLVSLAQAFMGFAHRIVAAL